jgi:hypothetical protein
MPEDFGYGVFVKGMTELPNGRGAFDLQDTPTHSPDQYSGIKGHHWNVKHWPGELSSGVLVKGVAELLNSRVLEFLVENNFLPLPVGNIGAISCTRLN